MYHRQPQERKYKELSYLIGVGRSQGAALYNLNLTIIIIKKNFHTDYG